MKSLSHIDLNQNELRNAVVQKLAAAPSNPVIGQLYYDTVENKTMQYVHTDEGDKWMPFGSGGGSGPDEYIKKITVTDTLVSFIDQDDAVAWSVEDGDNARY